MGNKIITFENAEFGKIRTVNIDNEIYFIGKDIGELLGYKRPSEFIRQYCDTKFIKKIDCKDTSNRLQKMIIINKDNCLFLIQMSKIKSSNYKNKLINWLKENNLLDNNIIISSRKEIEFIDKLEDFLKPYNLTLIRQYSVLNYRIDAYIKELNIAIEYDEDDHKSYTYEQHEGRQKEIEKELDCKFIRVSDKFSDEYNIGYIFREMFDVKVA